jgi:hypothetical protein
VRNTIKIGTLINLGQHESRCYISTTCRIQIDKVQKGDPSSENCGYMKLELVIKVADVRNIFFQTLALANTPHKLAGFVLLIEWIAHYHLPMVKDALRECLARGGRTKIGSETE